MKSKFIFKVRTYKEADFAYVYLLKATSSKTTTGLMVGSVSFDHAEELMTLMRKMGVKVETEKSPFELPKGGGFGE